MYVRTYIRLCSRGPTKTPLRRLNTARGTFCSERRHSVYQSPRSKKTARSRRNCVRTSVHTNVVLLYCCRLCGMESTKQQRRNCRTALRYITLLGLYVCVLFCFARKSKPCTWHTCCAQQQQQTRAYPAFVLSMQTSRTHKHGQNTINSIAATPRPGQMAPAPAP